VELCTAAYAKAEGKSQRAAELESIELAAYLAEEMGLRLHAGHGLDYHNVRPIARIARMSALNIGYSIVARALFVGLKTAVFEMKRLVS
jgi:pyridoxine 5-phosphate synthase